MDGSKSKRTYRYHIYFIYIRKELSNTNKKGAELADIEISFRTGWSLIFFLNIYFACFSQVFHLFIYTAYTKSFETRAMLPSFRYKQLMKFSEVLKIKLEMRLCYWNNLPTHFEKVHFLIFIRLSETLNPQP